MILQRYYGPGDTRIEYQLLDRPNFKKFLGLESGDKCKLKKQFGYFGKI